MKRLNYENITIVLIFSFISCFIIMFSNIINSGISTDMNYNEFFTVNIKQINVSSLEIYTQNLKFDYKNLGNNYVIYKNILEYKDQEIDSVRAVYIKGDVKTPNIVKGRFFTEEDFESIKPMAVVGSLIAARSVKIINGKETFTYAGVNYEVIGYMGIKGSSDLDSIAWVNMDVYLQNATYTGLYSIDGNNMEDVDAAFNTFTVQFNERVTKQEVFLNPVIYEGTVKSLNFYSQDVYLIAFIMFVLNILIITIYYIDKNEYKISVKKLCGALKSNIFKEITFKFIILATVGFILGITFFKIIMNTLFIGTQEAELSDINVGILLFSYIIIFCISFLLSILPVIRAFKIDTSVILKEN